MEELDLLNQFCSSHGMKVNSSKTNFLMKNGIGFDKEVMVVEERKKELERKIPTPIVV